MFTLSDIYFTVLFFFERPISSSSSSFTFFTPLVFALDPSVLEAGALFRFAGSSVSAFLSSSSEAKGSSS